MANIFLADEINRTPPKTQSGLLEAMEEKKVTVDGKLYPLPKPFMVIATQNPIEHLGTYPLPEAQLDRFIMKISIGYPNEEEELGILSIYGQEIPLEHLEAVVTLEEILEVQEEILKVKINQKVAQYIIKIAQESRRSNQIQLGISPRGTLAVARAARAWAYYQNRDFVTPDDIKKVLMPIVRHRIIPRAEAKYENISVEDILNELLKKITVPE